ncbi:MAG: hypothetical protein GC160_16035 [Acidobacteria bacterium]|nr:hypothetical protein [Acidobacteriota bacterium]
MTRSTATLAACAVLGFQLLASAQTDERAAAWLAKAQAAAGGAERLAEIQDVELERRVSSAGILQNLSGTQLVRYILPGTLRQQSQLDFGRLAVFLSGDKGWIDGPQGYMEMPPLQLRQAQGEVFRAREALLLSDRDESRTVRFLGETEQDGRAAGELEIASKSLNQSVRVWIDAESGDLFRIAYDGVVLQGQAPETVELFGDFRTLDGVRLPYRTSISQNGRAVSSIQLLGARFNSGFTVEGLSQR